MKEDLARPFKFITTYAYVPFFILLFVLGAKDDSMIKRRLKTEAQSLCFHLLMWNTISHNVFRSKIVKSKSVCWKCSM